MSLAFEQLDRFAAAFGERRGVDLPARDIDLGAGVHARLVMPGESPFRGALGPGVGRFRTQPAIAISETGRLHCAHIIPSLRSILTVNDGGVRLHDNLTGRPRGSTPRILALDADQFDRLARWTAAHARELLTVDFERPGAEALLRRYPAS